MGSAEIKRTPVNAKLSGGISSKNSLLSNLKVSANSNL